MQAVSFLSFLGYTVESQNDGVYIFRATEDEGEAQSEFIGLLLAKEPITGEQRMAKIQFFAIPCPTEIPIDVLTRAWMRIDARRLEESGVPPYELEVGPLSPSSISEVRYPRPDGDGFRHGVALPSGDVVCYN